MSIRLRRASVLTVLLAGWFPPGAADAQVYPSKPLRYVVPSSAGSGNDFLARIMANHMTPMLGQQVVVENRAGAGGMIAADLVAKAPADGHTILQVSVSVATSASLYRNVTYDLLRDFAPVTLLAMQPNLVSVHASLPVKSVAELVRLAKARPGDINFSSAGTGSNSFLATELLASMAGMKLLHVPYKGGGPAIAALAAGETSLMLGPIPTALPHIKAGRLRGLAIGSSKRLAAFPQFPTVGETVPGYVFDNWYGMVVPARTPRPAIDALHKAAVATLRNAEVVQGLDKVGYIAAPGEPGEYAAFLRTEVAKLARIIKETGASAN